MVKKYLISQDHCEKIIQEVLSTGDYPLGASTDSSAPYNEPELEYKREVIYSDDEINFDLLVTDWREFAIVAKRDKDEKYFLYMDRNDPNVQQFTEKVESSDIGKIDRYVIEAYATYLFETGKVGVGTSAYDNNLLAKIDEELRNELIHNFKSYSHSTFDYEIFIDELK